ncbi:MAG TPA: hypothetical protein ENI23_06065 [bacterium]|nr:hypothetical protein [bacterium]
MTLEEKKAAFVAAKWLSLDFVLINVLERPIEDIRIIHRDIQTFIDLFTKREKNEKIAINYGKKVDAVPAGPLADGINLAEEGVYDRPRKRIQRHLDSGDEPIF